MAARSEEHSVRAVQGAHRSGTTAAGAAGGGARADCKLAAEEFLRAAAQLGFTLVEARSEAGADEHVTGARGAARRAPEAVAQRVL